MEYESFSRQSMPRLRGGQWASEHCVQKVEEMLSRAIMQQEDLLDLLMSISLENHNHNCNSNTSPEMPTSSDSAISPQAVRALKAKIENSVDWSQLALCRLREITVHASNASPRSSAHGLLSSSYSKAGDGATKKQKRQQLVSSSARLNVPTPLSPLRVLLRTEPLSPHPFAVQSHSSAQWNPGNLLFSDSAPHLPSRALRSGEDPSSLQQQQRWRRRHQQQGLNFARFLANLQMDTSDWPLFQGNTGPMRGLLSAGLPTSLLSSAADPVNGEVTDHLHYEACAAVREDQSDINETPTPLQRGNRSRNSSGKSEVRKWSGGEAKLEVVFQKLNDAKKAIPDDGHRGWKKYGNKTIQNSNHCRGYYKCSVKECRAKKMVQPTDKDPTLFEVTYVGKHTCSSTGQRRRSSRSTPADIPAPVEVPAVQRNCKSAGIEREDSSILTESKSMTEGSNRENEWTGIIPSKRARSMVEPDDKASLDNFSYLHTMTTSTTTTASEEQVGDASLDTYLHQSSHHHQAVYSFQEPLLWHDFDMDTSLSTGHKSVSMDSDSP